MDLTQLANLGEFIGGVAVLVTLVYLALQVRRSAREQRASSMQVATHEVATWTQTASTSQELAEIWLKGLEDFGSLSPAERVRFSAFIGHIFRLFEQLYYQSRNGRVEPEVWRGFVGQLHDYAAYPGVETWWCTRSHWFGEHFREFIDSHLASKGLPNLYGESDPTGAHS